MNSDLKAPTTYRLLRSTLRPVLRLCLALMLTPLPAAFAQAPAPHAAPQASPTPAADHLVLAAPLPVASPADTIDVVALFWYGCPHCNQLEPQLKRWTNALPQDVKLRRMPAVLTDSWEPGAQLYYTLEALGQIERLHQAVFDAEHTEGSLRVMSRDEEKFADWAAKRDIDRTLFLAAWNGAAVETKVNEARQLTFPFRRIGVPAIIVDGRYLSTATLAGTPEAMLATSLRLIEQVRAERKKK